MATDIRDVIEKLGVAGFIGMILKEAYQKWINRKQNKASLAHVAVETAENALVIMRALQTELNLKNATQGQELREAHELLNEAREDCRKCNEKFAALERKFFLLEQENNQQRTLISQLNAKLKKYEPKQ